MSMLSTCVSSASSVVVFFNVTAPTDIYTLSLHDALPIFADPSVMAILPVGLASRTLNVSLPSETSSRSEEHTSELQSPCNLVCRLLLEKKKKLSNLCSAPQNH